MHKIALTSLAMVVVATLVAMPAQATDYSQEQWQKLVQEGEAECTGGAYGQDITCKLKLKQEGEQKQRQDILGETIVYVDGQKVHVPVDTALDTKTMAAVAGLSVLGGLAYFTRRQLA